jgi:hypothetical protein
MASRGRRKMFGKVGGCAVLLTPFFDRPDAGPLVVGEGIETTWAMRKSSGARAAPRPRSASKICRATLRLKGGALPLWALKADPERPPFLLEDPGEVIILVDADMKPLRDMRVQDDKGEPPISARHWRGRARRDMRAARHPILAARRRHAGRAGAAAHGARFQRCQIAAARAA